MRIYRELFEVRFTEDKMKPKCKATIEETIGLGYTTLSPPIDESYELELYGEAKVGEDVGFAARGNVLDRK